MLRSHSVSSVTSQAPSPQEVGSGTSVSLKLVLAICLGNILTFSIGCLVYVNMDMFLPYLQIFFWSWLTALTLRRTKQSLVRRLLRCRRSTHEGGTSHSFFSRCCCCCVSSDDGMSAENSDSELQDGNGEEPPSRWAALFESLHNALHFIRSTKESLGLPGLGVIMIVAAFLANVFSAWQLACGLLVLLVCLVIVLYIFRRLGIRCRNSSSCRCLMNFLVTVVLLVGTIALPVIVTAIFAQQCSREGVEAFSTVSSWVNKTIAAADPSVKAFVQSDKFSNVLNSITQPALAQLEMLNKQTNSTLILGLRNATLSFIEQLTGSGTLQTKNNTSPGSVVSRALFAPQRYFVNVSAYQIAQEMLHGAQAFNLTEAIMQGSISTITVVTSTLAHTTDAVVTSVLVVSRTSVAVFFWFTFSFHMLAQENDYLLKTLLSIVGDKKKRIEYEQGVYNSVERIVLLPVKVAIARGFIFFIITRLTGSPYPYFATLVVALNSFFPALHPVLALLPWWLGKGINQEWVAALVDFVVGLLLPLIDELYYDKFTHPYATSISIFAGTAYHGVDGLVLGPFLFQMLHKTFSALGSMHVLNNTGPQVAEHRGPRQRDSEASELAESVASVPPREFRQHALQEPAAALAMPDMDSGTDISGADASDLSDAEAIGDVSGSVNAVTSDEDTDLDADENEAMAQIQQYLRQRRQGQ